MTQRIVTSLTFRDQAEPAAQFWTGLFADSRITATTLYPEGTPGPAGQVMTVEFELMGQRFLGINGPDVAFTEAISLTVECEDQHEVDRYWTALTADGGKESQCGWCQDRFGVSWQIVPRGFVDLLQDPDPDRAQRAMAAMLGMTKLDLAAMQAAADG